MFYVVTHTYTGQDRYERRYVDASTIEVWNEPARMNGSGQARKRGWCGTMHDWALSAHGEFATLEEALAWIRGRFGEVRRQDQEGEPFAKQAPWQVSVFKPQFIAMTPQDADDWIYDVLRRHVNAATTDREVWQIADRCEADARAAGYTGNGWFVNMAIEYRDALGAGAAA